MSNYPDLIYTKFPDAIDEWEDKMDVPSDAETMSLVIQYKKYCDEKNYDAAQRLIESDETGTLKRMRIDAMTINELQHAIMAIERMWRNDLATYVTDQVFKDDLMVGIYTHTYNSGSKVHNFAGKGVFGRAKITSGYNNGDTFAVNGTAVTAVVGEDVAGSNVLIPGNSVSFIYDSDGKRLNFNGGGGLSNTKLASTTADTSKVLSGETFYSKDKTLKGGTMPNRGNYTFNDVAADVSVDIPEGYYKGAKINTKSLAAQTPGTLDANYMVTGQNGYSNGVKVSGRAPNHGNYTFDDVPAGAEWSIPTGYYNGAKIKTRSLAAQTIGNLESSKVLKDQYGYSNGERVNGSMPNNGNWEANIRSSVTIPKGYHSGGGTVSVDGGDQGDWSTTIDPGGSVTVPKGFHSGSGKVYSNSVVSSLHTETVVIGCQHTGEGGSRTIEYYTNHSILAILSFYTYGYDGPYHGSCDIQQIDFIGNKITIHINDESTYDPTAVCVLTYYYV